MKAVLSIVQLCQEAQTFAIQQSQAIEPALYGVTDGKAVGTYVEHKFQAYLAQNYMFDIGNTARGIDFPGLSVDVKVTSIRQPQSSCPFESARQKIYGLGYSLLVFAYEKIDDALTQTSRLDIKHVIFVDQTRTADFQTTTGLRQILDNAGNLDDLIAFMHDRLLPVDEIQAEQLALEIMANPPQIGYLTISNALQWRLQYRRIIEMAGVIDGINRVYS
jgi:hypothetical protein